MRCHLKEEMKLTNTIRDAFVRAAIQDVPQIDYDEQISKLALSAVEELLPPVILKIWKDPKLRHWLVQGHRYIHGVGVNVPTGECGGRYGSLRDFPNISSTLASELDALSAKNDEQKKLISDLRSKLHAAAYSCTTRKALVELLPEFEKYLPADEVKAKREMLPAVANILADFTKAGWPKGARK